MLKTLKIQDLILIENVDIPFVPGFNVLSGETGSGKSAIITALALVLGKRADTSVVRKGVEKGKVEALFESPSAISGILERAGIAFHEELIIRREIFSTGKSRAYINDQAVTLSLLQEVSGYLVKFVGQHANQQLLSLETHMDFLDRYGETQVEPFAQAFQELCRLRNRLTQLKENEAAKEREIEACRLVINDIESIDPEPGEDEELFAEYSRLTHAEDFQVKCCELIGALTGEDAVITQLNALKRRFEEVLKIDSSLGDQYQAYCQSIIELQEVGHILNRSLSENEYSSSRLAEVNDRMASLHRLKRKYNQSLDEILETCQQEKERLRDLENSETNLKSLKKDIENQEKLCDEFAQKLSEQRRLAAVNLEEEIARHFQDLNMPGAQFHVRLSPNFRSRYGDEEVEFFISPNVGEKQVSVTNCASGGELSRLMLAFQVLLAGKQQIPTIVFDEVDANIGGTTAVSVGGKLAEIGSRHQVLCITHFPQVASQADHHLQISKEEIDGRTLTMVQVLGEVERVQELDRMHGLAAITSKAEVRSG